MRYLDGSDTGARLTIGYTDIFFLWYHESAPGNKGMWGNIETGVVIHGRIWAWCLCFIYTRVFTISLVLESANERMHEV